MAKRRTRFVTWARRDPYDDTPLVVTFKATDKVYHFTSEDVIGFAMMDRVRNAWIEDITKVDGVWKVTIYED